MKNTNPDVDRYIEKAEPFARPILERIRKAFHEANPEVGETMKWGVPHFEYKGVLGRMAAFKQHVGWGFWKSSLMNDPHGILLSAERTAMGGMRVTNLAELAAEEVLVEYVREAIRLNEEGVNVPRAPRAPLSALEVPDDLAAALEKSPEAAKFFEGFPPSQKREYIEWITDAKQQATRDKRLAQAIEWIAEGKSRNWKYGRKK